MLLFQDPGHLVGEGEAGREMEMQRGEDTGWMPSSGRMSLCEAGVEGRGEEGRGRREGVGGGGGRAGLDSPEGAERGGSCCLPPSLPLPGNHSRLGPTGQPHPPAPVPADGEAWALWQEECRAFERLRTIDRGSCVPPSEGPTLSPPAGRAESWSGWTTCSELLPRSTLHPPAPPQSDQDTGRPSRVCIVQHCPVGRSRRG